MYDEDSFINHLFFIKIKRIFYIILFSIIGAALGGIISFYLIDVLLFSKQLRLVIIIISTLLFFMLSLSLTSNTSREIQDGYWKIAVLRKLTLISKKLDKLDKLDNLEILENLIEPQNTKPKKVSSKKNKDENKVLENI